MDMDINALMKRTLELGEAETKTLDHDGVKALVAITPQGRSVGSLKAIIDEFRAHPERRTGTASFTDLASFNDHVNRFKSDHSAVFLSIGDLSNLATAKPAALSVLDYHDRGHDGTPRFGRHRGRYDFPLSVEWQAWNSQNGQAMNSQQFSEFLENRILEVMPPPNMSRGGKEGEAVDQSIKLASAMGLNVADAFASQARLMEVAKGLTLRVKEVAQEVVSLSTGEVELQYSQTHESKNGTPLKVPSLFRVLIPVFRNGPAYILGVRLRYRFERPNVKWFFELYKPEKVFEAAVNEAAAEIKKATGLPLFIGTPEA